MIRIAIADDQPMFRNMLVYILEQEQTFNVIGSAGDGEAVVQLCRELNPDLVLLDVKMPDCDGISALLRIKEYNPNIKVIMLTTFEEDEYIYKSCSNAADGYIVKDTKPEVLINVIKCVSEGLFVMHSSVKKFMITQMLKASESYGMKLCQNDNMVLDTVDLMIVRYLSIGKNNSEIAQLINYSEGTVKNRISRMLAMTGAKDRTQLAIFALHNGIV